MKFQAALRGQKGETSLTSRREKSAAMGNDKSLLTVAIALSQHLIKECACSKDSRVSKQLHVPIAPEHAPERHGIKI
uniref:Uncharacterized protein n=1 Tax=Wuchereria bancrofti TaxID=6293 RepID=A0AAF5PGM3_WUCBA